MNSVYLLFVTALLAGSSSSSVSAFGVVTAPQHQLSSPSSSSLSYTDNTVEPGFEERMRAAVHPPPLKKKKAAGRPSHVQEVLNMEQFKEQVTAEKDQLVVVRFFAPWCRVSDY